MSLVDFVRDFNNAYKPEDLIQFYVFYFTLVAYGFYFGDLVFCVLTGLNFSAYFNPDDIFYAGFPYVLCFPVMAFAQSYVTEEQLYSFSIAVFGLVLAYMHVDTVSKQRDAKKVKTD